MKKITRLLSVFLALIALIIPSTLPALAETPDEEATHAELITKYSGLDMTPYAGKVVYMNFFTEWCPYCMDEMPSIKKVFDTYSPDELQVVLVHVWDGEDLTNSDSIRKTYGLEDMTFFEDEERKLSYLVSLSAYPLSVFFGPDGNIVKGINAGMSYEEMAEVLDGLGVAKK